MWTRTVSGRHKESGLRSECSRPQPTPEDEIYVANPLSKTHGTVRYELTISPCKASVCIKIEDAIRHSSTNSLTRTGNNDGHAMTLFSFYAHSNQGVKGVFIAWDGEMGSIKILNISEGDSSVCTMEGNGWLGTLAEVILTR